MLYFGRGIFIVFAVAECVALVRALRVVLLGKHITRPTWDKFLVVTALESAHVTGETPILYFFCPSTSSSQSEEQLIIMGK